MSTYSLLTNDLPICPTNFPQGYITYPSATILFSLFSLASIVFAIIIAFKYNSVKVFNRKIRTQNISNTMWIIFYVTMSMRGATNAVRYALSPNTEKKLDNAFLLGNLILHGITAFALCLALNHQRKYRSSAPGAITGKTESDPLLSKKAYDKFLKSVGLIEILFFVLFVVFLVFLYMELLKQNQLFYFIFLAAFLLQRLPVIILVLLIVIHSRNGNEGPTRQSKALLVLAALLNLANDLPLFVWASYLPGGCPLKIMSYVDLIHVTNLLSLLFFFLFLRSEYLRNMEECIWTTVSQIQDTFDFRRF